MNDLGTRADGPAPPLRPSGEKVPEGRMRGEPVRLSYLRQSLIWLPLVQLPPSWTRARALAQVAELLVDLLEVFEE